MDLTDRYKKFLDFNEQIRSELREFKQSIEALDIDEKVKKEAVEEVQNFYDSLYAVKMDISNPRRGVETDRLISDYKAVLRGIRSERRFRNRFAEANNEILETQVKRLRQFFGTELNYDSNLQNLAVQTLREQGDKSEYYLKLARKKGFLSRNSDYNGFKAENDINTIARFEEGYAKEFAECLKKLGFKKGDKILENRPVIYMKNEALQKANKRTGEAVINDKIEETAGVFKSRRLGDQKILLEDFTDWDSFDSLKSTAIRDEHYEKMWGESGRNLIFWHCHPSAEDVKKGARYSDRLSDGDVDMLTDTLSKGNAFATTPGDKTGIREGITLLSVPWENKPTPKEDIVWLACAVSSQGGKSGFFNFHIVEGNKMNGLSIVDEQYSWPKIYNKWIKAAMTGSHAIGPYSELMEVKSLEKNLGYS